MAHGAIEMNPLKGNCKCNSCESGYDGAGGNGYQPCASKLKRPPTVAHYPRGEGMKNTKEDQAVTTGLMLGVIIGFVLGVVINAVTIISYIYLNKP